MKRAHIDRFKRPFIPVSGKVSFTNNFVPPIEALHATIASRVTLTALLSTINNDQGEIALSTANDQVTLGPGRWKLTIDAVVCPTSTNTALLGSAQFQLQDEAGTGALGSTSDEKRMAGIANAASTNGVVYGGQSFIHTEFVEVAKGDTRVFGVACANVLAAADCPLKISRGRIWIEKIGPANF